MNADSALAGGKGEHEEDRADAVRHARSIVVWGVPSAIERGAPFRVQVGLKCSAECVPDTWVFGIRDHDGHVVASRRVGTAPAPGTAALFHAEAELTAPASDGLFEWQVFAPAVDGEGEEVGHDEASAGFNVRVVGPPECVLAVVAVERETGAPIHAAKVVVHPFRALTDERGVAQLRLPKGPYRLFVSGRDYFPFRYDGEADGNSMITAALEADRGPSDAELWS